MKTRIDNRQTLAAGRASERGLTLIEIMVVLAILGIMGTIVAVNLAGRINDAKVQTTAQSIKNIEQTLTMFKLKYNRYPNTSEGLDALINPPTDPRTGTGAEPFLNEKPLDGWGNPFQYFSPGQGCQQPYEVRSLGADGSEGGTNANADISSCPVGAGQ